MKNQQLATLDIVEKRVKQIKGFYGHLAIYIVMNLIIFLFHGKTTFTLLGKQVFGKLEFLETINWDVFGTPILWGVLLTIHAVNVFRQRASGNPLNI
ncbi:MAG: 2TM domain-containing protein [Maribacter sp.]